MTDWIGLPRGFLHLVAGAVIFGLGTWVLRDARGSVFWAIGLVVLFQFTNEALDALQWWSWTGRVNWADAAIDTLLTVSFPIVIVAVLRWRARRADAT